MCAPVCVCVGIEKQRKSGGGEAREQANIARLDGNSKRPEEEGKREE